MTEQHIAPHCAQTWMDANSQPPTIVHLVPKIVTRSEGCIKTLENMLTLARDGLLIGVAVAGVDAEGCTHTAFEGGENIATLIGAAERLKFRLLNHQDGNV